MKLRVAIVLVLSLMWGAFSWEWYTCRIKGLCDIETIMAEIIPASKENLASIRDNISNAIEDALADNTKNKDTSDSYDTAKSTVPPQESIINTLDKGIVNYSPTDKNQDELPIEVEAEIETVATNLETNESHQQSLDADNISKINTLDTLIEQKSTQPIQTTDIGTESQRAEIETPLIDELEIEAVVSESKIELAVIETEAIDVPKIEVATIESEAVNVPKIEAAVSEPKIELATIESEAADPPKALEVEELQIKHGQIHFPYRSHLRPLLSSETDTYLSNLIVILTSGKHAHLIGHTDNVGNDEKNHTLGLKRAKMIQRLLIKRGASKNSITIESKGKLNPIGDNDTEVGREINRRVEIIITP